MNHRILNKNLYMYSFGTNMIECNLVLISTSKFSKTTANRMYIISSGILLCTKH